MAWLRLTNEDGTTFYVNMDYVLCFEHDGERGGATIMTMAPEVDKATLHVKETPDEIATALKIVKIPVHS